MTQYTVMFKTGAFAYVQVEAGSPEEARKVADETFAPPFLCHQCAGGAEDYYTQNLEIGEVWEADESPGGVWES